MIEINAASVILNLSDRAEKVFCYSTLFPDQHTDLILKVSIVHFSHIQDLTNEFLFSHSHSFRKLFYFLLNVAFFLVAQMRAAFWPLMSAGQQEVC